MKRKGTELLSFVIVVQAALWWAGCVGADRRVGQADSLRTLEVQLFSSDRTVAELAAQSLLSANSEENRRILRNALATSDSGTTRAAIIKAFILYDDDGIELEAADALGDSDAATVALAKQYLIEVIGNSAAYDLLLRAGDDTRSAPERIAALEVIAKYSLKESVEGLIDILGDDEAEVCEAAAKALREITYWPYSSDPGPWRLWYREHKDLTKDQWQKSAGSLFVEVEKLKKRIEELENPTVDWEKQAGELSKRLVDLGAKNKDAAIIMGVLGGVGPVEAQVYAAEALGGMKETSAVGLLIGKAASREARLAEACIKALGVIRAPEAADIIASRLTDEDAGVRLAAARSYASLPDSDLSLLLPLVQDPSAGVRAAVAEAFGSRKWEGGLDSLLKLVGDEEATVRAAAAQAAGPIGGMAAVPALLMLADDPDHTVVVEAIRSLSPLRTIAAFEVFMKAAQHEHARVREDAVGGLGKIADLIPEGGERRAACERLFELATSASETDDRVKTRAWESFQTVIGDDLDLMWNFSQLLDSEVDFTKWEALLGVIAESKEKSDMVLAARRQLAAAYFEQENYQAALGYFRRVEAAVPGDAEALTGVIKSLEQLEDYRGLAQVYAPRVASGSASKEEAEEFSKVLARLLADGEYRAVVSSADLAAGNSESLDKAAAAAIMAIRAEALPHHLKALVKDLGSAEEPVRAASRNELSGYAREAAGALVAGLESPEDAVRAACLEILVALTEGESFGFDAEVPAAEQSKALVSWKAWLVTPEAEDGP